MTTNRNSAGASVGSTAYVWRLACVAALGGLLFGYDTAVISGAIGFLQEHFGLTAEMKGWAAASALLGCALGAAMAGSLSDRFGRRTVLVISAVLFFVSALGTALPRDLATFVVFRIVGGLGVGAASMTSPVYIAEITPARIRGQMVSVNQLAIVTGIVVVYFVNFFIARYGESLDQAALAERAAAASWNISLGWRWMFGSEAVPAAVLLGLLLTVPESPRFLLTQGHETAATAVLRRIGGERFAERELVEIEKTLAVEKASIGQLFTPAMRPVLLIGVALAILQQVTGINVFLYFAPEIFKQIDPPAIFAGLGTDTGAALMQTIVVGTVNLVATIVAIWSVDRLGRKPLMIAGNVGMGVSLTAMGLAAYWQQTGIWMLLFIVCYTACFAVSVGPVTWVLLSEIFPTKIRGRAMAIATVCLWVANFVVTQTFAMMDENPWLLRRFNHAMPFWIYAIFCVLSVLVVWRLVPETKGRSLEEIERGWLEGQ